MADSEEPTVAGIAADGPVIGVLIRRWAGAYIDFTLLGLLLFVAGFALAPVENPAARAVGFAVIIGAALGYFVVMEALTGRTVGKWMAGLVVMNEHGGRPNFGQTVIRMLLRIVEVNPILIGGLPAGLIALFTPRHQRLGDLLSKTYVLPVARVRGVRFRPLAEVFD